MSDKTSNIIPSWKEVFLVLIVVSVLAALLMPVIGPRSGPAAKHSQARTEIFDICAAIGAYVTTYNGRLPLLSVYDPADKTDFTFGTFGTSSESLGISNSVGKQANNSAIMTVLMDLTRTENGNLTLNSNHWLNPQRIVFLNVKSAANTNSSGLGPDGVYRDPWGHPYIITLNFKGDTNCLDAFYRMDSVSADSKDPTGHLGLMGLVKSAPNTSNSFAVPAQIMVWSLGPDGKADRSKKSDEGFNKDNLLSW